MKRAGLALALFVAASATGSIAQAEGWSLWGKKEKEPTWSISRQKEEPSAWDKMTHGTQKFFADTTALVTGKKTKKTRPNPYVPWIQEEVEPPKTPWYKKLLGVKDPEPPQTMDEWMRLPRNDPR